MLSERLVRAFVSDSADIADPRVRHRLGVLEGVASVVINLVVFVVKLVPGLAIGSIALIADAIHSLGDVASSAVVIWGFGAAARPSDEEHPFGHGRIESIASLVIAVLLLVAAVEFGKTSVMRLLEPRPVNASLGLLAVLLLTVLAKEWLARFSLSLGRRISSTALIADSWHHRSDVLATVVVIAALGAASLGVPRVDAIGGLVVSGFLVWAGYALVKESASPLIGEAPSPALVERVRAVALAVEGVDRVHDIIIHHYGGLMVVSLHIEVAADIDVVRGHELAEEVEEALMGVLGGWATVHVDPVNRDHPLYAEVERFLERHVGGLGEGASFHDLRIVGRSEACFAIFDLAAGGTVEPNAVEELKQALTAGFPAVHKVVVNLEPRYVY